MRTTVSNKNTIYRKIFKNKYFYIDSDSETIKQNRIWPNQLPKIYFFKDFFYLYLILLNIYFMITGYINIFVSLDLLLRTEYEKSIRISPVTNLYHGNLDWSSSGCVGGQLSLISDNRGALLTETFQTYNTINITNHFSGINLISILNRETTVYNGNIAAAVNIMDILIN